MRTSVTEARAGNVLAMASSPATPSGARMRQMISAPPDATYAKATSRRRASEDASGSIRPGRHRTRATHSDWPRTDGLMIPTTFITPARRIAW